jgi:hypothetical protein
LSASLSMVVKSSIAGNDENSSGRVTPMATMMTMRPTRILKVNKISRSHAGSGKTSMLIMSNTSAGIPRPVASIWETACRKLDKLRVAIVCR